MQKRTFRLIAITAGLLSGASLLFLCHRAKQQAQAELIAVRRGIVGGHHINKCWGVCIWIKKNFKICLKSI